jgi:hypothetical protein
LFWHFFREEHLWLTIPVGHIQWWCLLGELRQWSLSTERTKFVNKSLKITLAAMLLLAVVCAGCSDDDDDPAAPAAPPPTLQGAAWVVTSDSFDPGVEDFLMTFDTSTQDVIGVSYTFNGTAYSYDAAAITGAAAELGFTITVNAEWGASVFEFGGTVVSSGVEVVGAFAFTIGEGGDFVGGAGNAVMTKQ